MFYNEIIPFKYRYQMKKILNITNGDSAVSIIEQAGITGDILPWRDVLHDGPVPAGLSLEALSKVRTQFIVESGWVRQKISNVLLLIEIIRSKHLKIMTRLRCGLSMICTTNYRSFKYSIG